MELSCAYDSMILGIDLRCLPLGGMPGTGIAHASREITKALFALSAKHPSLTLSLYIPRDAAQEHGKDIFRNLSGSRCRIIKLNNATGGSLRQSLESYSCDKLFVPSGAVAPGLKVPVIPWVHDIAIFDHPEWFPESLFRRAITTNLFRKGIRRASHVLCVSQFTKDELVKKFQLDPSTVHVTLEGGDTELAGLHGEDLRKAKQTAKYRLAERGISQSFILYLGTLEPRKNLPTLLKAWDEARLEFKRPADLVIAGRDGWKLDTITASLAATQHGHAGDSSHLHRIEAPTDEHRRDLLLAAELVALPSFYEGFGLVALEAMQAGTAVLSSTGGALPEVVGDSTPCLQPDDLRAWRQSLIELMSNDAMRDEVAHKGKERSMKMDWDSAAEIILKVLTDDAV